MDTHYTGLSLLGLLATWWRAPGVALSNMYTDCDLRMEYKTIAELIRSKFLGK